MRFSFLLVFILLAGCGSSQQQNEIVDIPRAKSYYQANHSCDHSNEELDQFDWSKKESSLLRRSKPKRKRNPGSAENIYDMLGKGCDDLNRQEIDEIARITSVYGRELISPMSYDNSLDELQRYLDDIGGITNFSAAEITRPNHQHVANKCGYDILLPLNCRWAGAVAKGLMAEQLRSVINEGREENPKIIRLRNWFRPKCYNQHPDVAGARNSDHRWSRGFDLDFETPQDRAKAQRYLCTLYKERPFNLQVGIGCQTLHIGVGSPRGTRFWTYGTIRDCPLKRLEGDNCWRETENGERFIHTDRPSRGAL